MRLSNNSFPYPVLSSANSFDIDSEFKFGDSFSVNVDQVQIGQSDFELVVTYFLKSDDLQMMVNDG